MNDLKPEPAVLLECKGLRCDAPGCGYLDPVPELTPEYLMANIGRPCPKCGASLLTKEDAETTLLLQAVVGIVNAKGIGYMAELAAKGEKPIRERWAAEMDGSGKMEFVNESELGNPS